MRLIDADKLPWVDKLIVLNKCDGDIIVMETKEYASYVDEDTPTVKAIPIEWLRMWFTKKASLIGITLMSEIESDWEKENEMR